MPELPGTRVVQVDIAGDQLTVSDTFVLDGTYISARMTDDVARLVLHADPQQALPFVTPAVPGEAATERAQQMNREVVEQASAEDLLPHWRRLAEDGTVTEEGTLVDCDAAHAPNTFSGFGMVTVVSVDLSDGLRRGHHLQRRGGRDGRRPDRVRVAGAPLRRGAGVGRLGIDVRDRRCASRRSNHGTDIHRFDISDPHGGRVRDVRPRRRRRSSTSSRWTSTTATCASPPRPAAPWETGAGESESHVVVLAPNGDTLAPIGHVGGLGRGETIQSVRFIGSVGYVVTFEQTDPLYTIDLSDPANPHVAGELKILGFSAYLHPVGDGKLLGSVRTRPRKAGNSERRSRSST